MAIRGAGSPNRSRGNRFLGDPGRYLPYAPLCTGHLLWYLPAGASYDNLDLYYPPD